MAYTDLPWNLLGFHISGDVGDHTLYTDKRRRKVIYPFSPPHKPPSFLQINHRERFKAAMQAWHNLTDDEKENLEDACRAASLVMGGVALWLSACLTNRNEALQTVSEQTGIPLPQAPFIE